MASPSFPCTAHRRRLRAALAACAFLGAGAALAQDAPVTTLEPVVVTGRGTETQADVAGFGDVPLARLPLQAGVFSAARLRERGAQRVADLVSSDASLGDAYNTEGYWDFLTIRGFVLDNRSNFRRDGLPISAETSIALDNKELIEVLKGLSGLQAGVSAPGGLVNHVVKRPDTPLRSATLEARQESTLGASVDISQRFGEGDAYGLRVNAAYADLEPRIRNTQGHRHLLAAAGDWRLSPQATLEAEFETSRRVQRSVPGFSLLGNVVPQPGDPKQNLNDQPWSLPVVMDGHTASLRWKQHLGGSWWGSAHAATQRLRTDDRIAFPFGCGAEGNIEPPFRFCSDGSFDYYDFRSEGERRRTDALDLGLDGQVATPTVRHALRGGVLVSNASTLAPPQAFNFAGTGFVDGRPANTTPDPQTLGMASTRKERSTEWYLRARSQWEEASQLWWGLRHTRLARTGGDADYDQAFTTPWLAYSHDIPQWGTGWMGYVSWGQGVETAVVPNLPTYTTPGAPLPALRSRQVEAGLKRAGDDWSAAMAVFEIRRPQTTDINRCTDEVQSDCITRTLDGKQIHRGVETSFDARARATVTYGVGLTLLDATRTGSADPALNGKRPTNVPERSLRAHLRHTPEAVPGLSLGAQLSHEGDRTLLPGNDDLRIPSWSRLDVSFSYEPPAGTLTWRGGIDNLTDRRAWREAPYQFDHVYLFPLAPRTAWLAVDVLF